MTPYPLRILREYEEVVNAWQRGELLLHPLATWYVVSRDIVPTTSSRVPPWLVADGQTTRAIAHQLCCSPRTVHKHLEHAYRKLGVRDRINAVRLVSSWGKNTAEGQSTAGDPHRPRLEPNSAPAG